VQTERRNWLIPISGPLPKHWASPVDLTRGDSDIESFNPEIKVRRALLLIVLFVSLVITLSFPYVITVLFISKVIFLMTKDI